MARKNKNTITVNGDYTGDIGTVVSGSIGPVAMNGDVYEGDTGTDSKKTGRRIFSGKGMTVVKGDSHGTISRRF